MSVLLYDRLASKRERDSFQLAVLQATAELRTELDAAALVKRGGRVHRGEGRVVPGQIVVATIGSGKFILRLFAVFNFVRFDQPTPLLIGTDWNVRPIEVETAGGRLCDDLLERLGNSRGIFHREIVCVISAAGTGNGRHHIGPVVCCVTHTDHAWGSGTTTCSFNNVFFQSANRTY